MSESLACACINIFEEFDGCDVCDWVYDAVQERNPDSKVGANGLSLREAQRNFQEIGASTIGFARMPEPLEQRISHFRRDANWRPLPTRDEVPGTLGTDCGFRAPTVDVR